MNGVHDMGGLHGLGPIAPDASEPLFHAEWERRVLALTLAMGACGRWTIDASRHARERIRGDHYLAMSYYERWFTALVALVETSGLASEDERAAPPLAAGQVAEAMRTRRPYTRQIAAEPRFEVGDAVRARTLNPLGHTRLPRYVRGRLGLVTHDHGAHVFADTNAHGLGECPAPLYGVRFAARELWGEGAAANDSVNLDLWEPYLDPA